MGYCIKAGSLLMRINATLRMMSTLRFQSWVHITRTCTEHCLGAHHCGSADLTSLLFHYSWRSRASCFTISYPCRESCGLHINRYENWTEEKTPEYTFLYPPRAFSMTHCQLTFLLRDAGALAAAAHANICYLLLAY